MAKKELDEARAKEAGGDPVKAARRYHLKRLTELTEECGGYIHEYGEERSND